MHGGRKLSKATAMMVARKGEKLVQLGQARYSRAHNLILSFRNPFHVEGPGLKVVLVAECLSPTV